LAEEQTRTDLSEIIAENFGANATYVEGLLARWRSDPALVDESWRSYFDELVGANGASLSPADGRATTLPQADGSGASASRMVVETAQVSRPQEPQPGLPKPRRALKLNHQRPLFAERL